MALNNYSDVFETYNGSSIDFENPIYERFILNNEFATSFLGNDGTEVGIHGGMNPYHSRPPYMIIRNTNVAGRTTDDDKLSVEIEIINGN